MTYFLIDEGSLDRLQDFLSISRSHSEVLEQSNARRSSLLKSKPSVALAKRSSLRQEVGKPRDWDKVKGKERREGTVH